MTENQIARQIVDSAFRVPTRLGPGLLGSVFKAVLAHELENRGLSVIRQQPIPVIYDSLWIEEGFRADLVVNEKVIVELKLV